METAWIKRYIFNGILTGYWVTQHGDVYSNKRGGMRKMHPTRSGGKHGDTNTYVKVRLSINGKVYNRNVHRIVAETWIPNPDHLPVVNHKDGNKRNNNVSNLEWTTEKENSIHAYVNGFMGIGETFSTSTTTNAQCVKICELLESTDRSIEDIAAEVGVSRRVVDSILHGKTWTHISYQFDFTHRIFFTVITSDVAESICKLLEEGKLSSKEIATKLGCKTHHVKDIKRHKTWRKISCNYNF